MPVSDSSSGRSGARRLLRATVLLAVGLAVLLAVARWPVTTAVGYNYRVSVRHQTLFEKAVAFVDRDLQMRRIAREVAGAGGTPEDRVLRMYQWVADNIKPVPNGFPIVDDHPLHIFIRHYGASDQRAEALAILTSYDGMPAAALGLGKHPPQRPVQLTVVRVGDRTAVFDVCFRIVFRRPSGELATLDDLKADPSIVRKAAAGFEIGGLPYADHFEHVRDASPVFARMEKQRVWSRIVNEFLDWLSGR